MTAIEKVLQRKDGSSLIVGVVLAYITLQFITSITGPLTSRVLGETDNLQSVSAKDQYLAPLVALLLQLIAVELLVWVVVGLRAFAYAKPAKRRK
jgi:hypothetical protein